MKVKARGYGGIEHEFYAIDIITYLRVRAGGPASVTAAAYRPSSNSQWLTADQGMKSIPVFVSDRLDVFRLGAFLALGYGEFDFLSL